MPEGGLMIIDSDGGTDDLLAIMLALSTPAWKILAITCIFGNVNLGQACENILRVLSVCNRTDIPVFKGLDESLLGSTHYATHYHGVDGMGGMSSQFSLPETPLQEDHAISALVRLVHEFPHQVTLVALGPLTNVALAQRLVPSFSSHLEDIVIMGGNSRALGNIARAAEFNFFNDPEAAYVVTNEFDKEKVLCPVEACDGNNYVSWEWFEEWTSISSVKGNFVNKILNFTANHMKNTLKKPGFTSCDLITMTGVVHRSSAEECQHVNGIVELGGDSTRGELVIDWNNVTVLQPNMQICLEMDMTMVKSIWIGMLFQ